ncbi:DUF4394 domain-containing protein [Conexibacter sp. W3-3-2]|uniref:DUF4394 domain-containing protein n=1 Tax=Conexibacter sp. W3-3-2 TaxID=2675227 RepID=UPI0012B7715B|nr:DUF4394 domain-containing protein [Conexibacter sp. W3-3-2]MTD43355.1 DUF4394 domain-containing protein [Conexibacter sp. W3-3-2]
MTLSSRARATAATAALLAVLPAGAAQAETMVGIDANDRVVTFDSATPGSAKARAVRGLAAGETIVGLDRRPATGALVAVSSASRLYTLSPRTGQVTPIGMAAFTPALSGSAVGFDFNPTVDRIRLTTSNGQNLRLNPDTGAVAATDGPLKYNAGDQGEGTPAFVGGSAYTNNVAGATTTQLFNLDSRRDALLLQMPPNDGGLKTIGSLGRAFTNPIGFDISGTSNTAYASLRSPGARFSTFGRIDLATGRFTATGRVGSRAVPRLLKALTVR